MCCPPIKEAINRGREDVVLHFIISFFLHSVQTAIVRKARLTLYESVSLG